MQLLLHLVTNGSYGVFRDEYYYLACADRLAWGYVDQPPLSIWVLALWKALFGQSVHSIRVLPALCGSALIVLAGAVATQLGGGRWAQLLAGVGSGIGAAGMVMCGFYSMNCYDLLIWTGAYFLLIRIAGEGDGRWWLWLGLLILLPIGMPLLAPPDLDAYQKRLGIDPTPGEVGHTSALPQHFSDRLGWQNLARVVAEVYGELPADERSRTIVLGRNYGHSGALEYWSSELDLPPVYGRHNNYWLWGPPPADEATVVIAINFDVDALAELFEEVVVAGVAESEWALESHLQVIVCRGLKRPIHEVWAEAKVFI